MLKQLMIQRKIDNANKLLEELREKDAAFKTRSEELEVSISEAETDEEMEVVESAVEELETEQAEHDEDKKKLEEEVEELEGQLEELNNSAPKNNEGDQRSNMHTTIVTRESVGMKVKRGFFKGMERSAVDNLLEREDVKGFLDKIRNKEITKRGVEGGELGIPDVILGLIRDELHKYSKLISKVNLRSIPGTSRTNIVGDIPEAVWTEACATLNELDLKFYQVETDGYKVGGFIPVCNALLQDSAFNLASEIFTALGQSIGLAVDKAILYGTGAKMPVGIVTRLAEDAEPGYWGKDAPTWKDLSTTNIKTLNETDPKKLFAAITRTSGNAKANYGTGGKFWVMNEKTKTELQALLIEFNASAALVSSLNNTMPVIGGEIIELPFMSDNDIVGGYGSQYLLAERAGSEFASSEHVQFIQDNTVYKGTARYDGKPIMGDGFVAMNIGNTTPATTKPFAPDTANEEDPEGA